MVPLELSTRASRAFAESTRGDDRRFGVTRERGASFIEKPVAWIHARCILPPP
jgi:hypothetical protein